MAFRYRLESLLRLQHSLEHQEENRLLDCAARVAGLKNDLQACEETRLRQKAEVWSDPQQGTPGSVLLFAGVCEQALRRREKELQEQLKLAEAAKQEQMKIYRAARQKREMLESLKEREETVYTTDQLRRIQQDLDEAHLSRSFLRDNR